MNTEPQPRGLSTIRASFEIGFLCLGGLTAYGDYSQQIPATQHDITVNSNAVKNFEQNPEHATEVVNDSLISHGKPPQTTEQMLATASRQKMEAEYKLEIEQGVLWGACGVVALSATSLGYNYLRGRKPRKSKGPKQPKGPINDPRWHDIPRDML